MTTKNNLRLSCASSNTICNLPAYSEVRKPISERDYGCILTVLRIETLTREESAHQFAFGLEVGQGQQL